MPAELPRRLLAEAVGTALLVFFGAGSVVAALTLGEGRLDYAGLGMIAVTFGLAIAVAIYAFGTTSGAHINPAVTLALASVRRFPWPDVGPYIAAQLVGAVAGAALIAAAFGGAATDLGLGQTVIADGTNYLQAIVAEAIATFLLVTAIMALAVDRRAAPGFAGLMIGFAVTAAILAVGPLTGASLNPARTFGPLLTATIGGGETEWGDLAAYVVGPVVGGVLAALAYDAIARPRDEEEIEPGAEELEPAAEPAQGTQGDITGRRARLRSPLRAGGRKARADQGTAGDITERRT